jgi:hypothetical protein
MDQNAYKNGPMFFKLTTAGGSSTHAGVLEFSAAEGFVALPRKVSSAGLARLLQRCAAKFQRCWCFPALGANASRNA